MSRRLENQVGFGSSETRMELNLSLDEATHEQTHLETLLSQLSLSNPPPTSQFGLEDAWFDVDFMRSNIDSYASIMANGLFPSTHSQEQQHWLSMKIQEPNWQMMRYHTALRGQTGYSTSWLHGVPSSSSNINSNDNWISFQLSQRPQPFSLYEELNSQQLISKTENRQSYPLWQRFFEWKDHLHELMVHPTYHYQVQKLFEESNEELLNEILFALINNHAQKLAQVCTDKHGGRSMQKLLMHLKTPAQIHYAITALGDVTLTLAKSPNGQFVIRKCLQLFSAEYNENILNKIADNCLEIAADKFGCCVMQECVNFADEVTGKRLVNIIVAFAPFLSQHSYGNFVVQYILSLRRPEVAEELLAKLKGRFLMLSMNMHGSHVVEKFLLEFEEEKYSSRIIEELIFGNLEHSLHLFQDQWGNYVVQTAMKVAKGLTREALMSLINWYKPFLENHPHGKCVLAPASRRNNHRRGH